MAILDWVVGGKIADRPPMANFWWLQSHKIPEKPGAYILMAQRGVTFNYPAGSSPVFYIGQSGNLRSRLSEHLKYSEEARDIPVKWEYQREGEEYRPLYHRRYEYASTFGGRYAYLQTWQNATPKMLEELLLAKFSIMYRSVPVANAQTSWKRINQALREWEY